MKFKTLSLIFLTITAILVVQYPCIPTEKVIKLSKPDTKGGMPLMEALSKRHSSRLFSDRALTDRTLSNLLWAAYGINRKDSGKRTAPSAMDKQEIEVYASMKNGLYLYNAKEHSLLLIIDKDIRDLAGKQNFVRNAPLNLIYVADLDKAAGGNDSEKMLYVGADAAFIGQNVYLYCASEGLETVIRAYIDREKLGRAMNLKGKRRIIFSQTVGYDGK